MLIYTHETFKYFKSLQIHFLVIGNYVLTISIVLLYDTYYTTCPATKNH